jgi:hypothetical protein
MNIRVVIRPEINAHSHIKIREVVMSKPLKVHHLLAPKSTTHPIFPRHLGSLHVKSRHWRKRLKLVAVYESELIGYTIFTYNIR